MKYLQQTIIYQPFLMNEEFFITNQCILSYQLRSNLGNVQLCVIPFSKTNTQ